MSNDNVVEFPTKERKHDVMRERTSKINGFTSPFTNTNYKINSIKVDGESWEKWTFPNPWHKNIQKGQLVTLSSYLFDGI